MTNESDYTLLILCPVHGLSYKGIHSSILEKVYLLHNRYAEIISGKQITKPGKIKGNFSEARRMAGAVKLRFLPPYSAWNEHFIQHSLKTVNLFNEIELETATNFLNTQFENLFTNEQAPLFHVEHGVIGEENDPLETWKLVRLAPSPESELEQSAVTNLRKMIADSPNVRMYQQTIKEMAQVEKKKLVLS